MCTREVLLTADLSGLILIIGNYGSGKTEVALNLAVRGRARGLKVAIADLDVVNPYFRTREAALALGALGIEGVLPAPVYKNADLPIIVPRISGMIRSPVDLTILDVGGDDAGSRVLASLADAFVNADYRMLQVVNHLRPFTDTVEGCLKIQREIEASSGLKVDGIIGNSHLMDETEPQIIYDGARFAALTALRAEAPLEFVTVEESLWERIDHAAVACEVMPLKRMLNFPWKAAAKVGPKNFILH